MVNRKSQKAMFSTLALALVVIATGGCGGGGGGHQPIAGQSAPMATEALAQTASIAMPFSDIQPILKERCVRCHSNGPLDWNDPSNLARVAKNGKLAIYIENRYMPQVGSPEAQAITIGERDRLIAWAKSQLAAPAVEVSKVTSAMPNSQTNQSVSALASANIPIDPALAVAYRCMACHGPNGISTAEAFPNLAGHGQGYLSNRLKEFLSSSYQGVMAAQLPQILKDNGFATSVDPVVNRLDSVREVENLISYLARFFGLYSVSLKPADVAKTREEFSAQEKSSYETGRKLVVSRCLSCHLTNELRPIDVAPMIFGQRRGYLQSRMQDYLAGRGKTPNATIMSAYLKNTSPEEISNMSLYLSTTLPTEVRAFSDLKP